MKKQFKIMAALLTALCFGSDFVFAQNIPTSATTFMQQLSNFETLRAYIAITDLQATELQGENRSFRALVYADKNRQIFTMDPHADAQKRYIYKNGSMHRTLNYVIESQKDASLRQEQSKKNVDETMGVLSPLVPKIFGWLARFPQTLLKQESPIEAGIKVSPDKLFWAHPVFAETAYKLFLGFDNKSLNLLYFVAQDGTPLYSVTLLKVEFDKPIPSEKFEKWRIHPTDEEKRDQPETWWKDADKTRL